MSSVRAMTQPNTISSSLLSSRQRLALTHGNIDASSALAMPDAEIDALFLIRTRVPVSQLRSSRLTPLDLKTRGITTAIGLRELGFDALELTDAAFCASAVAAFGAENVKSAFLLDAGDAVAVAGSTACLQLTVSTAALLELCAGAPTQAKSVLQQLTPRGGALHGVSATVLLDTGLRAKTLCGLGYFLPTVGDQTGASRQQLSELGFV